nr:unnamed protein product [Callosobruchus chinensis]
MQSRERLFD